MNEHLEMLRRDLEVAGANSTVILDLRRRAQIASGEIRNIAGKVEVVTDQIEAFWTNHIGHLTREHEQRLQTLFPDGIDITYRTAIERMTGLRDLDEAFFRVVFSVRNILPEYPTGLLI